MIDRLTSLYQLQLIDDQLDELESQRGDLPLAVRELERKLLLSKERVDQLEEEIKESEKKRKLNIKEMEVLNEQLSKHKAQLFTVRNNKEYDALTKSIDSAEAKIAELEKENEARLKREKELEDEVATILPNMKTIEIELEEKNESLKTIIKANEKEEAKIREERAKIEVKIKKPDLAKYLHIRKAKNGKAVATIKRNACSGCHNVIPPQRQLEIRKNDRLFTCDSCGRILISTELAEKASQ